MNNLSLRENKEMDSLKDLVNVAMKSGKYGDMNDATMLNIMLSAKSLGINPMKAINGGFHVIKGKICMSTALMCDRIRKDGHSIKVTEWTSQKCVIIGTRKDNGDSLTIEFTLDDAKTAGLSSNDSYKKYPKNMLYNRAMSNLARMLFPDIVGACYSEDEKDEIDKGFNHDKNGTHKNEDIILEVNHCEKSATNGVAEISQVHDKVEDHLSNQEVRKLQQDEIISYHQFERLEWYVEKVSGSEDLIKRRLKLNDISEMKEKDYENVLSWLKIKVGETNEPARMA